MVNSFFGGIASSTPTTAQRFSKDLPESRRDLHSLGNSSNSLDINFPAIEWNTVFRNLSTSLFSSLQVPGELSLHDSFTAPNSQSEDLQPHQIDGDQDKEEGGDDAGQQNYSGESYLILSQVPAISESQENGTIQLPLDGNSVGDQDSAMESGSNINEDQRSRIGQILPQQTEPADSDSSTDALQSSDDSESMNAEKRNAIQQSQEGFDPTDATLIEKSLREQQRAMSARVAALDREPKASSLDDSIELPPPMEDGLESGDSVLDIESARLRRSLAAADENTANNSSNLRSERSRRSRLIQNARATGSTADANPDIRNSNYQAADNLAEAGRRVLAAEPVAENFENNSSLETPQPPAEKEVTVPSSEPAANNLEKNVRATLPAASNKVLNPSPVQTVSEEGGMSSSSSALHRLDRNGSNSLSERVLAGPKQEGSSGAPAQIDRLRLIQRVARSFSRLGSEGGSVQLRLHPPELGTLSMRVRLEGRKLSASLIAESSTARDVILESLPQLRTRLAEQGYEVSQFSVDIADSDSGNQAQSNPWDQADPGKGDSTESRTGFTRSNRSDAVRDDAEPSNAANWNGMSAGHGSLGGIDVKA